MAIQHSSRYGTNHLQQEKQKLGKTKESGKNIEPNLNYTLNYFESLEGINHIRTFQPSTTFHPAGCGLADPP